MNDTYDGGGLRLFSDEESDVRWMSYAELGHARGISVASAKRLTLRRKWRRQAGNDGTARVAVPTSQLVPRSRTSKDLGIEDAARLVTTFEAALSALREQWERERDRADLAAAAAAEVSARLAQAESENAVLQASAQLAVLRRESLERALTAYEAVNADLDMALAAERSAREKIEADVVALRQAEAARSRLGRMTRLRKAWHRE